MKYANLTLNQMRWQMQDELTMDIDLRMYWQLIRRWLWLIVLAALLAGGTAYIISKWMVEPVYHAAVRIIVQPSSSLTGSDYADIMAGQRAAQTYAEMLNSRPLQEAALLRLGYAEEQLIPYELTITPVRDTQVLQISVESIDAQLTADLANMLAQVFMEENRERQTARFQDALARLQKQIDALEQDIGEYRVRLDSVSDSAERSELESQITRLQDSLSRLTTAYQSIQLAELQAADLVSIIEPARYPEGPIRPRKAMNALLAAVVGSMVAVGGVFLQEYLDTSVKSANEAERLVEAPVLGRIWHEAEMDKLNGSGEHGVIINHPLSLGAEAYRLLRTNLQFTSVDEPLKAILVTSPSPGEGKSTVALNLALALEATGKRVILIDADMRRPKLCKYAQVEREPGLSETLASPEMDWQRYLQPLPMQPEIQLLPPGHSPPNPTELLGSRRMEELLAHFREREDVIVIVDSPPVLVAADATILSAKVDGVLLVVEVGSTARQAIAYTVEQVRRSGARLLGTVLNKVPMDGRGSYYHYGYYSEEEEKRSSWPWAKKKRRHAKSH